MGEEKSDSIAMELLNNSLQQIYSGLCKVQDELYEIKTTAGRLDERTSGLPTKVENLTNQVSKLEVKSTVWGSVGGAVTVLLTYFISLIIGKH